MDFNNVQNNTEEEISNTLTSITNESDEDNTKLHNNQKIDKANDQKSSMGNNVSIDPTTDQHVEEEFEASDNCLLIKDPVIKELDQSPEQLQEPSSPQSSAQLSEQTPEQTSEQTTEQPITQPPDQSTEQPIDENDPPSTENNIPQPQPQDGQDILFNINQHNNPQQTIVHVRDRLFHALFYRLAIMYARKFPKTFRRFIEFFMLILAIGSFGLLSYLHVFNRNPINCLTTIQDKWPRDGILRVEIVYNASELYVMSYDASLQSNQGSKENTINDLLRY